MLRRGRRRTEISRTACDQSFLANGRGGRTGRNLSLPGLPPGAPAFGQFKPDPLRQRFEELRCVAATQSKTGDETTPSTVGFSQRIHASPPPRDLRKTPIIQPHNMKDRTRQRSVKRRLQQRTRSELERLRNDSEIIQSEVEPERNAHQVPLAHVFV